MRIENMINKDTRNKLNILRSHKKKSKKFRKTDQDSLSDREIEALMGIHRPRYVRDRGAFRQR